MALQGCVRMLLPASAAGRLSIWRMTQPAQGDQVKGLTRRIRRLEEEIALVVPDSDEWRRMQDELAEASTELSALRAMRSHVVEKLPDSTNESGVDAG